MSNPADAGREANFPIDDLGHAMAPNDSETAALDPARGDYSSFDIGSRDTGALTTEADMRRSEAMKRHPAFAADTLVAAETQLDRVTIPRQLGPSEAAIESDTRKLDAASEPPEVTGHVVGIGSAREITADFKYQYGHMAVALANEHTRAVIEEDAAGELQAKEELDAELASLRKDFADWEAGLKASKSDEHFEATGITTEFNALDRPHLPVILTNEPTGLDGARTTAGTNGQPDTDTRHNLFSWFQSLSDEQLVNYFQWSEARTNAISEALIPHREDIQQNVRDVFDNLIAAGLAPKDSRDALERGFDHTTIFGALSAIESGFYQADGIYETDAGRLGARREYSADEAEKYVHGLRDVFVHEFLHGYDAANNTGLTLLLNYSEEPLVWVDEAVKQHLTEAGTSGQPHVLNPADRYLEGTYRDIRELLHLTLTAGESVIALSDVLAANFEQHDAHGPNMAREQLVTQLRESYKEMLPDLPPGETILHVIAKEINAAPKPLQDQVVKDWLQKLSDWRDEKLDDDWL